MVKTVIIVLIPIGVLLDILVWRRRHFAIWIYYYELLSLLNQHFVPFDYGDFANLMLLMAMLMSFILHSCDLSRNIISCTIVSLVMMFGPNPIIYKEIWSFGMIIGKILNAFFIFTLLTVLSMVVTYVA